MMKLSFRRVVVRACLWASVTLLPNGVVTAAELGRKIEGVIETVEQQFGFVFHVEDALVLAAVALVGLVGIARRHKSS